MRSDFSPNWFEINETVEKKRKWSNQIADRDLLPGGDATIRLTKRPNPGL